jgi:hypothetical protein
VLLARLLRLGALACFMLAVGLPCTLAAVLVLMAVMGGVGSSGPASAPMRIAVLSASLPATLGGHAVGFDAATGLLAAAQVGPMVGNLAISVVVLGVTLRTVSPKRVLAFVTRS